MTNADQSPDPTSDEEPLLAVLEEVYEIEGRPHPAIRIQKGRVELGDEVEIVGFRDEPLRSTVESLQSFNKSLDSAEAEDLVVSVLSGVQRDQLQPGQVVATPETMTAHSRFRAEVTLRSDVSNGDADLSESDRITCYFRMAYTPGEIETVDWTDSQTESGDPRAEITVHLETPIAMTEGLDFALHTKDQGERLGYGTVRTPLE